MGSKPDEARGTDLTQLVIMGLLLDIRHRVTRLERKVDQDNTELGVELDKIEADDQAEAAAVARVEQEVADLKAKATAGTLTGEEHQRLAALENELEARTARLNAEADAGDGTVVDQPVTAVDDGSAAAGDTGDTGTVPHNE